MELDHVRSEIEHMRIEVGRQRKEILQGEAIMDDAAMAAASLDDGGSIAFSCLAPWWSSRC